jgi:hypothetical protein
MRREEKVQQIYEHTKLVKVNISTMVFLIAMMNDKALTKFHKEFLEKPPDDANTTRNMRSGRRTKASASRVQA